MPLLFRKLPDTPPRCLEIVVHVCRELQCIWVESAFTIILLMPRFVTHKTTLCDGSGSALI